MSDNQNSFLGDRFTPAALPEVYAPRRELLSLFHTAAARRFVYIEGPAGSGKTVSALLWLEASGRKSVWIGLDEYDNAPSVFYKQFAAAILSLQPDNEGMNTLFADPHFSTSPVEHTIGMIAEMHPTDNLYAIVLDDAHLVTNGEIIKSLPAVLKRLPGTFVTLIISRESLPDSFRRVVAEESIITFQQLKFSSDEIHLYFLSLGRFVSPEQARFAHTATDGLAIGVSAIAMSEQNETGEGASMFAQYFEDNVWNAWDERTRDFCLKTSVLDEFTPAFAARLTGYDDAGGVMERLSRSNAFLSRLHEGVYRFHHLFQDFLRDKAARSGVDVTSLYKAAAAYYRENGDYQAALRFWLDSDDYKGADTYLYHFMFEHDHGTISEYLNFMQTYLIRDFPDRAYEELPSLHICCAWYCYYTGQYREYERHMDAIFEKIDRIACHSPLFVEYAMHLSSTDHRFPLFERLERVAFLAGHLQQFTSDSILRFNTAFAPYLARGDEFSDVILPPNGIEESIKMICDSKAVLLLGDQAENILFLASAGCSYEQNDLETVLTKTNRFLSDAFDINNASLWVSLKMHLHGIFLKLGRDKEASAVMDELNGFVNTGERFFLSDVEAYKAKIALADCDADAARNWLEQYYVEEDIDHIVFYKSFRHFTTARAYIVLADYGRARKLLDLLRDFGQNLNRFCDYSEASVLLAALEWAAGKKKEAVEILMDALLKLQPYKFSRVVADEGASVMPILKRIARTTGAKEYEGNLKHEFVNECMLAAYAYAKRHKGITAGFTGQQKPVKLSKQQKLVITLLSKGYTNAMIIEETGLKITTIRTHTTLAYEKLDVNNAMDAVLRARELGLIE